MVACHEANFIRQPLCVQLEHVSSFQSTVNIANETYFVINTLGLQLSPLTLTLSCCPSDPISALAEVDLVSIWS